MEREREERKKREADEKVRRQEIRNEQEELSFLLSINLSGDECDQNDN